MPDGQRDTDTAVSWLQGPTLYGDVRQPIAPPDFSDVRCLRDLRHEHIGWLAEQEGFAGPLVHAPDHVEWRRRIDFQPKAALADRGVLRFDGPVLVEDGYERAYVEHWRREAGATVPAGSMTLTGKDGCCACLLIVGAHIFFARDRSVPLEPGRHLRDVIDKVPTLTAKQDLLDCELSLGSGIATEWRIERSTLPYRLGVVVRPRAVADGIVLPDILPEGASIERVWRVESREGTCPGLGG